MDPRTAAQGAAFFGDQMNRAGGPLGLVGRVAGLGGDELDAGVPGWAWFGVGAVAGAIALYFLHPRIEAFVGR